MGTSHPNVHFHHLIERAIVKSTAEGEVLGARGDCLCVAAREVLDLPAAASARASQTWRTFLANNIADLVSIDFFTVPTARLRVLFVLVVLAPPLAGASSTSTSPSIPPPPGRLRAC
jgi:hypothetical protein